MGTSIAIVWTLKPASESGLFLSAGGTARVEDVQIDEERIFALTGEYLDVVGELPHGGRGERIVVRRRSEADVHGRRGRLSPITSPATAPRTVQTGDGVELPHVPGDESSDVIGPVL